MNKARYLTKSRFKLAVDCPAKLFYTGKSKEYRDTMQENDFLAMLAEGGYQVGELAKLRYPGGIEIRESDPEKAAALTRQYLQQDNIVLFEPAIQVGDYLVRVDILVKTGNRFKLVEVKAKSYDSTAPDIAAKRKGGDGISSGMRPYIQDAAFQAWVMQQAFPGSEVSTFLMMPDKANRSPVDGINQMFKIVREGKRFRVEPNCSAGLDMKDLADSLLTEVCVDEYVVNVLSVPLDYPGGPKPLPEAAAEWALAYRENHRIPPVIGSQCGGCQYKNHGQDDTLKSGFKECWAAAAGLTEKDFEAGTVLDIWNFRKKQSLIENHVYRISQVHRHDLGDFENEPGVDGLSRAQRQWLQVGSLSPQHQPNGFYFDHAYAAAEMSSWKFPLHFIDFETSSVALPFYRDMRPYEPVAFQFSHHVMESDGSIKHAHEFLCAEPGEFPNYKFARALKKALEGDEGSVFMWSHHENTILNKIIDQLGKDSHRPDDAEELQAFIKCLTKLGDRAMVDLCDMAEKAFFHPDTKGSNSIKKVLPAMLKSSRLLRETYSKPLYGAQGGIESKNFKEYAWVEVAEDGSVQDPYAKLKNDAEAMLPEGADKASVIAEGGAAATAYARLQFEGLDEDERSRIKSALLRYCELDTLAMVMVVQGWNSLIQQSGNR